MSTIITQNHVEAFREYLLQDEKSRNTISKYMHDIQFFLQFLNGEAIDKEKTLSYKEFLEQRYAISSANSMLAAMNSFLRFLGLHHCCVRQFRIQRKVYSSEKIELSKGEYERLVATAKMQGNERLALIIQTICGTGIRVSELPYVTVEAAKKGEAMVSCKGKIRVVFIVPSLRKKLLSFAKQNCIHAGEIFVTKSGRSMHRSNIWRDMKQLCEASNVLPDKVFPHNLRHLFARTFYKMAKDISKLSDILGHTSIDTTRIYIMTTGMEHRREMERMRLVI